MERSSQLLLNCLLNASWQIALITAVAAFCAWLLRDTAARYRHALWVVSLALCFCLPVLTGLSVSNNATANIQTETPAPIQQTAASSTPIPLNIQASISSQRTFSFIPVGRTLAAALIVIYLLLLCYRGVNLLKAWTLTRGIARSVLKIELPEHVRTIIERCRTALGMKWVRVLSSATVPLPLTVGSLRPIVILPEPLVIEGDRDILTSAIGHELVHVRRRDYRFRFIRPRRW
jgi:beta-lactamase regulating signal transducer with metallopeptidase domain